jgi:serine/threonine protein kinase
MSTGPRRARLPARPRHGTDLKKIGKYEVLAQLGQGAMGTVYRARDPILDRDVALKTVAPALLKQADTMARFQREARAAARLRHHNIVTIYELGETDGTLFIAMELLEGLDLAEAMTPKDRLPLVQKLRIVVDICRGLDYAHKHGVFHRDVKPANVRILEDGTVKIVDFGIARLEDSTMTKTGMVLGTPSYMAPEILRGARVDHRADMWAVGVVLYELLRGLRPFDAPTIAALVYKIVHEPAPALDAAKLGVPGSVAAIVEQALAKDPAGRYRDMAEMADALQMVLGMTPSGERPLTAQAREEAYWGALEEAKRLFTQSDLEGALTAARRAQALEPSRAEIIAFVKDLEESLQDAPTRPSTPSPAAALAREAPATRIAPRPSTIEAGLATGVLEGLRREGGSFFREIALFGEPLATATGLVTPTRDMFVLGGTDGGIRLWDLRSRVRGHTLRTEMHERTGHDAVCLCLAISRDGRRLASGHADGGVHLWDLEGGQEIPVRYRHDALVGALAFSPDGQTLASGGMDQTLKLWNLPAAEAGESRRELYRQPAGITALCYAGPSGALLVTGHANRMLRLVDARTGRLVATLRGPEAQVGLLEPSPDRTQLAAASHDRTLRLFDVESRQQLFVAAAHRTRPTASIAFFGDGRHLASVAQDNAVQLWDLASPTPAAVLWGQAGESFTAVALIARGSQLAVALADGRIRLWGAS